MADKILTDLLVKDHELIAEVLESMWEGVAIASIDSSVLTVNAAGKKILGTWKWDSDPDTWSETFGLFHLNGKLFPTEELPIIRAFQGEKVDSVPMLVRSGELENDIILDVTARPLRNEEGQITGGMVVFRDVTEKFERERLLKEANEMLESRVAERTKELTEINEALSESEKRFRALADGSPVSIVISDYEQRFEYLNPAFKKLLGYQDEDLLGKTYGAVTFPEDMEVSKKKSAKLRDTGEPVVFQKRYVKKNGDIVWCETTIAGVKDKGGKVHNFIAVLQDITERLEHQQKEQDAKEQLRRLSNRILQVQEKERTRIARDIHDEFGQVMTALRYDVAWMKKRLETGELTDMAKKLDGMDSIIKETISNVRRMTAEFRPRMLDDLGLVAAIEWQSRAFEERTNISSQFYCEQDDVPLTEEQRIHLFRVFQEALTNVARHAQATRVETWLNYNPGRLFLKIRDNGVGMDDPHNRSRDSLGLVGIEERVRQLNGEVMLESAPSEGTTLNIRIPLSLEN